MGAPALRRHSPRLLGLLALAGCAAGLALAAGAEEPDRSDATLLLRQEQRAPRIWNSKQGMPIVSAGYLEPGESAAGKVRVANRGPGSAALSLSARGLRDFPGPNGGLLSSALRLRVNLVPLHKARSMRPVKRKRIYRGALAEMPTLRLGTWRPGTIRRYKFRVRLPNRGLPPTPTTGDDAYQGSRTRLRFLWSAR
jgi:hypothetical protein